MTNVVRFYPPGSADNPDLVLEQAIGAYQSVLILGFDKDGKFKARGSTNLSAADCHVLASLFAHKIVSGEFGSLEKIPALDE